MGVEMGRGACVCVCECGKVKGPKQGMCSGKGTFSPSDMTDGRGCKGREGKLFALCQRALTERQACGVAAHLSEVTALPLSASHSLVMPAVV